MQSLESFFKTIADAIWGNWLIVTLVGVGVYYTVMTGFIQIRKFPMAIYESLIKPFSKKNKGKVRSSDEEGTITPFQALCNALASCVGNGNIVGVATAVASGGPGAVFWMWVAAFFGMATKYAEILIGMKYRVKDDDGNYIGGPMYYISRGMKLPWLASIFSVLLVIQISGGNLIQSNAVAGVCQNMFGIKPIYTALGLVLMVGLVIIGGVKRLANVNDKLVPFMALLYIIGGIFVILFNFKYIPDVFALIFKGAFSVKAGLGGAIGYTMKQAMRYGIARGLYSNEAGEGSAPVLHSSAITDHPTRQALFGITEVFIDTFIICTISAFSMISTGVYDKGISPAVMVSTAFGEINPVLKYVVGISQILFAYSSIPAQWYFGNVGLTYLLGAKKARFFKYVFTCFCIAGCLSSLPLVWYIQDCALGFLVIPNLISIIYLSPQVFKSTKEFFNPANGYLEK